MSLKVDRILGPGGERERPLLFPGKWRESLARHYFRGIRRSAPSILHYKRPLSPTQSLVRFCLRVRPFHHSGYRLQNAMLTDESVRCPFELQFCTFTE